MDHFNIIFIMGSSQSKVKSRYNSLSSPIDEKDSKSIYDAFASKLRESDDSGREFSFGAYEEFNIEWKSSPKEPSLTHTSIVTLLPYFRVVQ